VENFSSIEGVRIITCLLVEEASGRSSVRLE
jgi:hypothetical protein